MSLEELLREVAQAAPREMGAEFSDETPLKFVEFSDPACYLDFTDPDPSNGTAIVAMLEAMENAGWWVDLRIALDETGDLDGNPTYGKYTRRPGWYEAWVCYRQEKAAELHAKGLKYPRQENYGKTRAEAVAKAFVSVFRAEVVL
jgi:hypothetical protein